MKDKIYFKKEMSRKFNSVLEKKVPFIFGVLLIFGFISLVYATTTISDTGITTTGNFTVEGFIDAQGFNNKLMRANDSVFETVTNGTEYFSANQYGGFYGTVFIKFFNFSVIAGGATEQIAHGVTGISRMISLTGSTQITNGDFLPIPHASTQTASQTFQITTRIQGSNVEILSGSARITPNFRIENGTVRFEYTK